MEFEVKRQVNSRWHDGRTFSAMPGRRVEVDEADTDLVAHMQHLVETGDVVEVSSRRTKKTAPAEPPADPDTANKIEKKPAAPKAAAKGGE